MLFRTVDIKELQRKRCIEEFHIIIPVGNIQNTSIDREKNLLQQPWPAWALTCGQYQAGDGMVVSSDGTLFTTWLLLVYLGLRLLCDDSLLWKVVENIFPLPIA